MPVRRNGFGRDDYRTPPALIEYIHLLFPRTRSTTTPPLVTDVS